MASAVARRASHHRLPPEAGSSRASGATNGSKATAGSQSRERRGAVSRSGLFTSVCWLRRPDGQGLPFSAVPMIPLRRGWERPLKGTVDGTGEGAKPCPGREAGQGFAAAPR
jgi:hypothetical protein